MDQRFGIDPSPSLKKTKREVSIYKSRGEFTSLTDSPPGVAGFFRPSTGELHFYHDFQDPSESTWIALHEGTHLLTFLIEPQADPWIWVNEGVADYFGAAEVTRDRAGELVIEPGQLLLQRVLTVQQAMADGTYVPLERLFVIPPEDFEAFEYAHAWSFVYFLNTARPDYAKAFKRFFKDLYTLAKGVSFELRADGGRFGGTKVVPAAEVRRLLLAKLGHDDAVALEREWIEYTSAIPIDGPEARFRRGIERMYSAQGPEQLAAALADLDEALAGGVEDSQAFWARGVIQLIVRGDVVATLADLRAAVERAPLSGGYRANLGQLLAGLTLRSPSLEVRMSPEEEEALTGSEEALVEAEELLGLACELEPESELFRASRDTLHRLLQARVERK
jgi:hypothetical protein